MRIHRAALDWTSSALIAALGIGALQAYAAPIDTGKQWRQTPLALAKEGSFYVGGRRITQDRGFVYVDQMYVDYQVPARRTHSFPLVLVPGGGITGAIYEGTPDDREGWREFFVRAGYTVYVVDSPASGRSAYNPTWDGPLVQAPPGARERMFTRPERFLLWPQARLHDQFPGTGLPGDPAYEQIAAASTPLIGNNRRLDEINRDALVALLDRIGPAILLTHSRSGPYGWLAADARPELVKGIVAIEPHGPPFRNPASRFSGQAPPVAGERVWGITYAPLTFDPPTDNPADLAPHEIPPQAPDLVGCWQMGGRRRTLPHLAGIPILIVTSEASYHAQYDQCTSQFLTAAGVRNDHVRLQTRGIHGNGHLMMIEKNNLQIAELIDGWISAHEKLMRAPRPRVMR